MKGDVAAIRRITSVEDDVVETDVRSAVRGVGAVERYELLLGPSAWTVPIPLDIHHSSSTVAAVVAYLLAGVRGRPAIVVTLSFSGRPCSNSDTQYCLDGVSYDNSDYSRASVSVRLLQMPRVKITSQCS